VRHGKVRAVAVSNYASWQVCRMHWIAERNGYSPVRLGQPMYNLLARGIEQEYLPMCRESGVANFVYNPLAGGLLTGKHGGGEPEAGTRFDGNKLYRDRYWNEPNFEAVRALAAVARDAGRSLVSLALNWILHHTPVEGIVLGVSRIEQLEQNLAAVGEGPLPEGAPDRCDEVWRMIRGAAPQYNR
jgi:aryl-alcohol dehydrogenase-like predicted oxidoreductase